MKQEPFDLVLIEPSNPDAWAVFRRTVQHADELMREVMFGRPVERPKQELPDP